MTEDWFYVLRDRKSVPAQQVLLSHELIARQLGLPMLVVF